MWSGIWLGYEKWKTDTLATNSIHSSEFHTDILLNVFSVFLVSVCLKKKLHTSFPPNQKRLCEVHKDGKEGKNFTDSKKVFFFFYLCIKRAVEKDKKWEARKEKGGKPVSLTKKFKVRKQRLLTSPNLALCPHLSFWTTAQYWKLLPATIPIRYLTRQGAPVFCASTKGDV